MNHEGTPILFTFNGAGRDLSRDGNLGVFLATFNAKSQERDFQHGGMKDVITEKARVWSPVDLKIHTCFLSGVDHLDGKALNLESVVILDWKAIIHVMPVSLSIMNNQGVRLNNVLDRARLTHYIDIPSSAWPKNMNRSLDKLKPQACWITRHNHTEQALFNGVCFSQSGTGLDLNPEPVDLRDGCWLEYNPKATEQSWQTQSRNAVSKMMLKYEKWIADGKPVPVSKKK